MALHYVFAMEFGRHVGPTPIFCSTAPRQRHDGDELGPVLSPNADRAPADPPKNRKGFQIGPAQILSIGLKVNGNL